MTSPEQWYFASSHLDRAFASWRERDHPSDAQIEAFYEWCAGLVETGPRDVDSFPVPGDEDAYVSWVPAAGAYVTYLAVAQDGGIFVERIESAG